MRNSQCNRGEVPLQPLVRELPREDANDPAIGELPPPGTFPATREALYGMTAAQIALLGVFYGVPMPGFDERSLRDALAAFVGAPAIFHA